MFESLNTVLYFQVLFNFIFVIFQAVSNEYNDKLLNVQKQRIKTAKESIVQLVNEEKLKYNEITGEMSRQYSPGDLQVKFHACIHPNIYGYGFSLSDIYHESVSGLF